MLSKSAEYALRALHRLAFAGGEGPVTTARLAARVGAPENYLSKLLHRLEQEGLVDSRRGRGGGFALADPPDEVTLDRVVAPFDDVMERRCLLGRPECRDDDPCPAHDAWLEATGRLRDFFRETTLAELGPPGGNGPGSGAAAGSGGSETRSSTAGRRSHER